MMRLRHRSVDKGLKPTRLLILGLLLQSDALQVFANNSVCGGSDDFLSFVDRPSVGENPCVVPEHSSVLELGYQYVQLSQNGRQQNLPAAEYRIGLPDRFEFFTVLPNYIHQTVSPVAGFTETSLGVKHELIANEQWVVTVEGVSMLPSGSAAFGSKDLGGAFNAIVSYSFTSELSLAGMLGLSSQSQSILDGGQSYTSINPDLILSWGENNTVIYVEVYGQNYTGPHQGQGYNMDAGISYLIKKNIVIDFEVGKHISGNLGGFNQYLGTGIAFHFG